jgi:hypothetical protein
LAAELLEGDVADREKKAAADSTTLSTAAMEDQRRASANPRS